MVDITIISGDELVNAINQIILKFRGGDKSIDSFYLQISNLNNDIEMNVSSDLYEDFKREKRCVYHESLYGDGEYVENVVNECITVLEEIIAYISVTI